jgi:hypothetical protein
MGPPRPSTDSSSTPALRHTNWNLGGQFLRACIEAHQLELGVPDGIFQRAYGSLGPLPSNTWIRKVWAVLDRIVAGLANGPPHSISNDLSNTPAPLTCPVGTWHLLSRQDWSWLYSPSTTKEPTSGRPTPQLAGPAIALTTAMSFPAWRLHYLRIYNEQRFSGNAPG